MPRVHLIFARARNGVIGSKGALPWHLPEDLAHFRRLTHGAPVIMGRKTWDSLPPRFRPLPGRRNIVVTRQENWNEKGCLRTSSLHEALQISEHEGDVWIIGGAQIYAEALPWADTAEVTEIDRDFDGDAYAPVLSPADWTPVHCSPHISAEGQPYQFVTYHRVRPASADAARPDRAATPGD